MFKLIALRPLEGCRKSALKCLREGQMYYFCNVYRITKDGMELRDEYVRPLPEDFFRIQTPSKLQINVSAVVGMNGDGKSTLNMPGMPGDRHARGQVSGICLN